MAQSVDSDQVRSDRQSVAEERSLGELFAELSQETTTLVRQEIALAKTEMSHKAAKAGKDIGFLAAGGAIAYAGVLAIIAAIIVGLGQLGVTWWLAAAIVGIVVVLIGAFLIWSGMGNLKETSMAPTETLDTLKEDVTWAKVESSGERPMLGFCLRRVPFQAPCKFYTIRGCRTILRGVNKSAHGTYRAVLFLEGSAVEGAGLSGAASSLVRREGGSYHQQR